jgi:hypothetical protein
MLIKVVEAKYLNGYQLALKFDDGISGMVDLESELRGPVFEPLKDSEVFKNFELDAWTVCWPNGADFAPEFIYELVNRTHKLVSS